MKIISKRANGKRRVQTIFEGPSLTQQQFKDDCDVNFIMDKYMKTGVWPATDKKGMYADVSEIGDYQSMLEQVKLADEAMMTLPPELRNRFGGDPGAFIAYLQDPANYEESVKLGLREEGAPVPKPKPAEEKKDS